MNTKYIAALVASLSLSSSAFAWPRHDTNNNRQYYNRAVSHAGQTDTDGILSPGERRNPLINYNRAQLDAESRGDFRVENPYNDAAARDSNNRQNYDYDRNYHQDSRRYYYNDGSRWNVPAWRF